MENQTTPSPLPKFSSSDPQLFQHLESYAWATDPEFQSGLRAILGPTTSQLDGEQVRNLTLRARCYYFTRLYNQPIDYEAYLAWHEAHSRMPGTSLPANELPPQHTDDEAAEELRNALRNANQPVSPQPIPVPVNSPSQGISAEDIQQPSLGEQAMRSPGFAEIVRMIENNEPIPGIRTIPDTVMTGKGTEPTLSARLKPWEVPNNSASDDLKRAFGRD